MLPAGASLTECDCSPQNWCADTSPTSILGVGRLLAIFSSFYSQKSVKACDRYMQCLFAYRHIPTVSKWELQKQNQAEQMRLLKWPISSNSSKGIQTHPVRANWSGFWQIEVWNYFHLRVVVDWRWARWGGWAVESGRVSDAPIPGLFTLLLPSSSLPSPPPHLYSLVPPSPFSSQFTLLANSPSPTRF